MSRQIPRSVRSHRGSRQRVGAILSVEWLMVFPILVAVMFAITEFSLLWSAKHLLEAATYAAAREASLPASDSQLPVGDEDDRLRAAISAAERIFGKPKYVAGDPLDASNALGYRVDDYDFGDHTGDSIEITLSLPMTPPAAPDLLKVMGISLKDKRLTATTVMRRE